jgi:hypothetical protein
VKNIIFYAVLEMKMQPHLKLCLAGAGSFTMLIPVALYIIYITGVLLFGKFEFCINSRGSYFFFGILKYCFKKQFSWNEVFKIYCEKDKIFSASYKICLHGKNLKK